MGDLEQVLFIEQAELDGALFDQGLDLESTQCGDEVELGRDDVVFEAGLGEHSPVAHETDLRDGETLFQLFHLGGHRLRIAGVALEHLDRDRAPPLCWRAAHRRSAAVRARRLWDGRAPPRDRSCPRRRPRRRHRARACPLLGDGPRGRPRSCSGGGRASPSPRRGRSSPRSEGEHLAQRRARRLFPKPARAGELGRRIDHLGDDHRRDEVA